MQRLLLFFALLTLACRAPRTPETPAPARPNIVYIYADDLGYGELGCYGQTKIRTPHLDRMAAEGMRFTQHYTGAPVCAPARCMLLTGQHGGHSYIRGNYELGGYADSLEGGQMPLAPGIATLPEMLRRAGYATALCGKWGLGMTGTLGGSPLEHGFDYYFGYLCQKQAHNFYPTHLWENDRRFPLNNPAFAVHQSIDSTRATAADFARFTGADYAPARITEKALDFIRQNRSRPFFLYLPYTLPHVALQAPPEAVQRYVGQFEERPYYGQKGYCPARYPRATYAAMISYLDEQVGRVLAELAALGLDQNTLVLFSSDNGPSFAGGGDPAFFNSAGGLRGLKMDVYEGGIRVPFLARWPGRIAAGQTSDHPSAQYDLPATLAELTGLAFGPTDGISFLPTLLGRQRDAQRAHAFFYFEYPEKGGQLAVRLGDWKGVKTEVRKQGPAAPWQLFDLRNDPAETTDLSARHPELLRRLDELVAREHLRSHVREWEFVSPKF